VRAGNVQEACSGRNTTGDRCTFLVDNNRWGDPAQGCAKDFSVSYQCEGDQQPRTVTIAAEAAGKAVELDCYTRSEPTSGLNIRSATYGGNCGAAQGNATRELASSCNGKTDCAHKVDVNRLGDPARKCGKDFVAIVGAAICGFPAILVASRVFCLFGAVTLQGNNSARGSQPTWARNG
jgi:hypothetical protein